MTPSAQTPPPAQPRIAVVTGASRGLGAAWAEALGARGWHVVAVARTIGALEELDDRIQARGGQATLAPIDLTQDDAIRHLCRGIHDRWGHADLWVHAAIHAPPLSPTPHIALKDWDRTLSLGLRATGVLIGMVEPLLRAAPDGCAVFFDDRSTHDGAGAPRPFWGGYGAAKAGQMALASAWAAETAPLGRGKAPRVVIDAPAPMPTATRARFFPGESREKLSTCMAEAERGLAALGLD